MPYGKNRKSRPPVEHKDVEYGDIPIENAFPGQIKTPSTRNSDAKGYTGAKQATPKGYNKG